MKKQISFIIIVFSFLFHTYSQPELKFSRYTTKDGLAHNDVLCICQDKFGFMWFGTKDGVSRFNGITFKTWQYNENDTNSMITGWVNRIVEDNKGRLWFAFAGNKNSLLRFDYENEKFIDESANFRKSLKYDEPELNIWDILIDSEGLIWFQLPKYGIASYNLENKEARIYDINIEARGFFEDDKKNLWFTAEEIVIFDKKSKKRIPKFKNLKGPEHYPEQSCSDVFEDSKRQLWFATGNGLYKLKSNPGEYIQDSPEFEIFRHEQGNPYSLSNNTLYRICEDENNNLFIASIDGLNVFNTSTKKVYRFFNDELDPESINSNLIRSVFRDRDNNIWVATNKGIGKLQKKNFRTFSHSSYKQSISHDKVQDVLETSDGKIWVATPKGLDSYNRLNGDFHYELRVEKSGSELLGPPLVLLKDSVEGIWIGTWSGGLSYFNTKNRNIINFPNKTILNDFLYVFELFIDSRQNLWIGTAMSGLRRFNLKTKRYDIYSYDKNDSTTINSNRIMKIFEDSNNDIWIGTNVGLARFNPEGHGHFIRYVKEHEINTIYETHAKDLLIGTRKGLFDFNRTSGEITIIGKSRKNISGMLEDDKNNLWISADKGLARYTIQNDSILDITTFREEEGLRAGNFYPRSCIVLSDKSMVFGGSSGFCLFNPEEIKKDVLPPDIVIEEFRVRGTAIKANQKINNQVILQKSISETKNIRLNHKNNAFSIEFVGIQYNMPQYNKYSYLLEGYDEKENGWHYADALNREVKYMNLPAGEYVFKLKAANSYGIWNPQHAELHIEILPPWWQTWWFRILFFLIFVTTIVSFYLYRVNALKRQKCILEQKVAERTSELREANSQLEEKQEEILQQNEEILTVNEQLRHKNEEVRTQKEEIESQKQEIENSRDQLEKAFNNITLLSEFGQKITATFDFDAINKMIFDYVSSLMDTAAFGIGIYNEKRKVIDFPYFMENGKPVPYFFKSLTNEKSLSARCFKNSEEIFINELTKEYQHYLKELPEVQTSDLPKSVIHLPLIVESRPIGTITVNSFKKNAYSKSDVANLRTLASYISIALDNSKAYRIIRSKNEQISGSIRYGKTIQQAMLPPKQQLDKHFENFVLFRPKDIVSGDFYWFVTVQNLEGLDSDKNRNLQGLKNDLDSDNNRNLIKNLQGLNIDNKENLQGLDSNVETRHVADPGQVGALSLLAVVDCTGHGVPGAFMSMIGSRLLNDIVIERKIYSPAKILEQLNIMVRNALRQDTTDNHDGMDVCLCCFQQSEQGWQLTYAGAKRPLLYYNAGNQQIEEMLGTRRSIGGVASRKVLVEFSEVTRKMNKNDVLYLSTDGFTDQCNPKKRKFSQKRLIESINSIHNLSLQEQKEKLEIELDSFQEGFEQRDDITLVGVKLLN